MKIGYLSTFCGVLLLMPLVAGAVSLDFSSPVVTGSSQAAGVWYTDRYAPAGFTSPTDFMGSDRLLHQISSADGASSRPGGFNGAFYNTQGRKYDLAVATSVSRP